VEESFWMNFRIAGGFQGMDSKNRENSAENFWGDFGWIFNRVTSLDVFLVIIITGKNNFYD
jgi:hypothetical protein